MKLLKDLILLRKEFQDWDKVITWSRNGTLYFNTAPEITIAKPTYNATINRNAKELFYPTEYPLPLSNKLEHEFSLGNSLVNSQPNPVVRNSRASRFDDSNLLAVLTNNDNVLVFKGNNHLGNLDQPEVGTNHRIYHCFQWSPIDNSIVVGNEAGELIFFQYKQSADSDNKFVSYSTIKLGEANSNQWVTHVCWEGNVIIAGLSNNSVYKLTIDISNGSISEAEQIKEVSRFKIFDMAIVNNKYVAITTAAQFHRIDLATNEETHCDIGITNEFYIVPIRDTNSIVLLSHKTTGKIDLSVSELAITQDQIISSHVERKFKKWNSEYNEFNKYETNLMIHGVALSPDGYSVAVVYNIERVSLKYTIVSERQYHVMFIPLSNEWDISPDASGLAWYQTYNIYNIAGLPMVESTQDVNVDAIKQGFDTNEEFSVYLQRFFDDGRINKLRFANYISENDTKCIDLFRQVIYQYAIAKREIIENPLDIACIKSLSLILNDTTTSWDSAVAENITIKSEFITQKFNFNDATGSSVDEVVSIEGNHWKRCSVTLLPILTTKVKKCPVTSHRVLDTDETTEYGWFTRTLIEVCSVRSVYSGTAMQ